MSAIKPASEKKAAKWPSEVCACRRSLRILAASKAIHVEAGGAEGGNGHEGSEPRGY